jgi:hypothetical protein
MIFTKLVESSSLNGKTAGFAAAEGLVNLPWFDTD